MVGAWNVRIKIALDVIFVAGKEASDEWVKTSGSVVTASTE